MEYTWVKKGASNMSKNCVILLLPVSAVCGPEELNGSVFFPEKHHLYRISAQSNTAARFNLATMKMPLQLCACFVPVQDLLLSWRRYPRLQVQ